MLFRVPVLLQILSGTTDPKKLLPEGSVIPLPKNKVIEVAFPGGFPVRSLPLIYGYGNISSEILDSIPSICMDTTFGSFAAPVADTTSRILSSGMW